MTKIEGLDDVVKKLKLLPQRVGRNAMKRSLRKGANVIRNAARVNAKALDDPNTKLNQIWKNIVVQSAGKKREKEMGGPAMRVGVLGGARKMQKYGEFSGAGKGNPGGDTWYWRLVEFGTSEFAAKPFMRPAMVQNTGKVFSEISLDLTKQLDKEISKL